MENQHQKIKGYRELNQNEIDLMNTIKSKGAELGDLILVLETSQLNIDKRWVEISKTNLQQGIMALVRSVAKPDSF